MNKFRSIQSSLPAPEDRPDFAEWFAKIKRIDRLNPVYRSRLNSLHFLRTQGVDARLLTFPNKRLSLVIVGVAIGDEINTNSNTINHHSL